MVKFLRSLVGVEEDELKPVFLTIILGFAWGTSQMFSYTSANTIFLGRYGAEFLAYSFVLSAIFVPLVGYAVMKVAARLSFTMYVAAVIVAYCVSLAGFRFILGASDAKFPSLLYLLWIDIEATLTSVLFMGIVNKLFTLRQSKRLYGICRYGFDSSFILGGLGIPLVVRYTGALALTNFALVFDAIALAVYFWMVRALPEKIGAAEVSVDADDEEASAPPSYRSLFGSGYIVKILAVTSVASMTTLVLENAYFVQVQSYLVDEVKIASFLSIFFTASSALVMFMSGVVTPRFMKRFGVATGLFINPVVVGLTALVYLAQADLDSSPFLAFALVVAIRLSHYVLYYSIRGAATFSLFQAISARERDTTIHFSETVMANVAGGVAGVLILVMTQIFGAQARGLVALAEVFLFAWTILCVFLAIEYTRNLSDALKKGVLGGSEISLADPAVVEILSRNLQSDNATEIMTSLDLLERSGHHEIKARAMDLSTHALPLVRAKAAGIFERLGNPADVPFITGRLENESDSTATAAWLRALGNASEGEAIDRLEPWLRNSDPVIATGAYAALIKYCSVEGMLGAGGELLRLSKSADAGERRFAARVIGEVGLATLYRLLRPLLADGSMDVRLTATSAAGALRNPKLIPALIENLRVPELRHDALKGIIDSADLALPHLDELYHSDPSSRTLVVHLYGRIRSKDALARLRERLRETDHTVLVTVVQALESAHYTAAPGDLPRLREILSDALKFGGAVLAAESDLGSEESDFIVREALRYERLRNKEHIFSVLGMLYPGVNMSDVRFNYLHSGADEKRALAIELLDNILHKSHRDLLIALFEDSLPAKSLKTLGSAFPEIAALGREQRIREIAEGATVWPNKWLNATAYHAMLGRATSEERLAVYRALEERKEEEILRSVYAGENEHSLIDKVLILKKAELFEAIPDRLLAKVAWYAELVPLRAGGPVFSKGDTGSELFIIARGSVRIHAGDREIARLGEGQIFGELSALSPEVRTADATSVDESLLLRVSQSDIERLIEGQSEVARGVIRVLCRRIRDTLAARGLVAKPVRDAAPPAKSGPMSGANAGDDSSSFEPLTEIEKLVALKSIGIFSQLDEHVLKDITHIARERRVAPGRMLFRAGDSGTSMFVIVRGGVRVHDGDREIAVLGDRSILGELAALSSESRSASVTAIRPTSLLTITQKSLDEIMWEYPSVAKAFIRVLIERLRGMM